MIVLRGADAELIGVMAALPPDLSPFQIGTRGEWKGRGFEIIGRIRVEWDEGSWNEWCILYDAKTHGWLAEAQGLLMISFPREVPEKLSTRPIDYRPKVFVTLDGSVYTVTDVKTATYLASEGELPFAAPPRTKRRSADLTNPHGSFATIELSEGEAEVYLGEYVDFDALKLTNLRPVPGWSAEIAQEKYRTAALSCPVCGAAVELRAAGQTMSAVCGSCGSVLDTVRPEVHLIEKADKALKKLSPVLPIGQRGKLFDTEYEVIGFVQRADKYAKWHEYLLFNPWQGFRWLVFFKGHWSFVTRLAAIPTRIGNSVKRDGLKYKLYSLEEAKVTGVLGEFYWKVRRGEKAVISDFVAPPYILSQEAYPGLDEVAWSRGEYIERSVIGDAFKVEKLPRAEGMYLNQPNRWAKRWKEVRVLFMLAFFALCFIQCSSLATRQETEIAKTSFTFDRGAQKFGSLPTAPRLGTAPAEPEKILTTPHFNLESSTEQRVLVVANAPVSNNWIGLELDLVNAKTNAAMSGAIEISAYHGYDSDGGWNEGSQTASVAFAAVPPGEYFLTIEPSADPSITTMPFTVSVRAGGLFNLNFILMILPVLAYPAFLLWRRQAFEARRWAESDYTP